MLKRKSTLTNVNSEDIFTSGEEGLKTVSRKGAANNKVIIRPLSPKQQQPFSVPTQNRFNNLQEAKNIEEEVMLITHKSEMCGFELLNKYSVEQHKRSGHKQTQKKVKFEENKDETIRNLKSELSKEKKKPYNNKKCTCCSRKRMPEM